MTSLHLVDPELLGLLEQFPPLEFNRTNLPLIRARTFPLVNEPGTEGVRMTTVLAPGPQDAPAVPLTLYVPPAPAQAPRPAILHIHGGGYVTGSAAMMEPALRSLSLQLDCVIAAVEYRLAPENPFPAPLEDCYAALSWLHSNAHQLGVAASRIGVLGESAGGGLAAALALLARDRGGAPLSFQHLVYPMLDDRTCVQSDPHPYAGEFLWTRQRNCFGWASYLGAPPGSDTVSAYAAPARMPDLSRLPPTFIYTGALDLFLEEDLDYARRLTRHGVPVELHVYPGAYHAFDLEPRARVSEQARQDHLAGLRRALWPRA